MSAARKRQRSPKADSVRPAPPVPPPAPHKEIDFAATAPPASSEREVAPQHTPLTTSDVYDALVHVHPPDSAALAAAFWQCVYANGAQQIFNFNLFFSRSIKGDGFDFFYRDTASVRIERAVARKLEQAAGQRANGGGPDVVVIGESGSMALVVFYKPHECTRFRSFRTLADARAEFIRQHPFLLDGDQEKVRRMVPEPARQSFDQVVLRLLSRS